MNKLDFKQRPLSWSAISQFRDYSKEEWYNKYILGKRTPENAAMTFGKLVGDKFQYDPTFLPEVERHKDGTYEYELRCNIGKIPCIGFIDFYYPEGKLLLELKTGKTWDKEKAEGHQQLHMYALMLMIQDNIKPEDLTIRLISCETESRGDFQMCFVKNMKPVIHEVKLTTKDCLMFGASLVKLVAEMEEYVATYPLA
jgi:predicted RecB family nuclease